MNWPRQGSCNLFIEQALPGGGQSNLLQTHTQPAHKIVKMEPNQSMKCQVLDPISTGLTDVPFIQKQASFQTLKEQDVRCYFQVTYGCILD